MSTMAQEQVVLVVGACALDRLLTVNKYPDADAKMRTIDYHEIGGGNAANTAAAMGFLRHASFLKDKNIRIKLLSKVGDDVVGQQLVDELNASSVDTSSPLFVRGATGSTTAFATIIVSETEHTRTCLFTPGTCGELALEDAKSVDLDEVFANVVHLHSDSRHTLMSLFLAKEAKSRGISVSCDSERDRKTNELDELMKISDDLFTNSSYLRDYIKRLNTTLEDKQRRTPLPRRTVETSVDGFRHPHTINILADSLSPSAFYSRWYRQENKQVIVTHGSLGALHFHPRHMSMEPSSKPTDMQRLSVGLEKGPSAVIRLEHDYSDFIENQTKSLKVAYTVHTAGVCRIPKIVDTTGAGDAFIGGYLMAMIASSSAQFAMDFASWVAGCKLEGPGARSALPKGNKVDSDLGTTQASVKKALRKKLSPFNNEVALSSSSD